MAGRRKGTFAFDLSHPIKKGVLLKQGAFHKAFKYRFFLVYPGFLVYYDQENRWLLDLTKGETLGVSQTISTSRLGVLASSLVAKGVMDSYSFSEHCVHFQQCFTVSLVCVHVYFL